MIEKFIAENVPHISKTDDITGQFGQFWNKGLRVGTGQANVKAYNRRLCNLIEAGKAAPSFLISHELPLERAAEGYKNFDARKDGWTKVLLRPGA